MTDHPDFVAQDLVRSYSDSLRTQQRGRGTEEMQTPRAVVEDAFCEEVERQDALAALLREAMSSRVASQKLKDRYKELEEAMKAFQTAFPEAKVTEGANRALSWSSLLGTITDMRQQHDEKSKKSFMYQPKKGFHKICDIINNHSSALKMLPQGDKYTSIITGSVEMITKASVNYVHIGEDFAIALEEIDRIVMDVQGKLSLYRTPYLEDLSIQLCCKILIFVTFPLKWYSQRGWKRARSSLNENMSVEYRKHVDGIRGVSEAIQKGAQLCTAQEVRNVSESVATLPGSVQGMTEVFKYWMEIQELHQRENWRRNEEQWNMLHQANQEQNERLRDGTRYLADMSQHFGAMFDKSIGGPMKQILDREALEYVNGSSSDQSPDASVVLQASTNTNSARGIDATRVPNTVQTKGQIEEASAVLDQFFDYDHILVHSPSFDTFAEAEVIQRLQMWTVNPASSLMALSGPASLSESSSSQLIASNYVRAARAAGLPCISYFCSLTNEEPPKGRLRETIGLVSLVYALIKQLISHIPLQSNASTTAKYAEEFSQLDGTLRTWNIALSLLKSLLALSERPLMLVVVHGLELLEHEATNEYLNALVNILKDFTDRKADNENHGRLIKVLFTTSGVSHVLGMQLAAEEMFDNNRGEAALRPGQARKGRRNVSDVSFPQM